MDDRRERKSSDDLRSTGHRGNRIDEVHRSDDRRGDQNAHDVRRDDGGNSIGEIAGGRRGNQMKEEKAQLDHSSGPGPPEG